MHIHAYERTRGPDERADAGARARRRGTARERARPRAGGEPAIGDGEPTRFTILYLLAEEGQLRSGELAELLERRQNDLYHHLNTLEDAGLVGKFRDGGSRVYELSPLAEGFVPKIFDAVRTRAEAV